MLVTYQKWDVALVGRAAPSKLDACRTGERVLIELPQTTSDEKWWPCEVKALGERTTD